MSNGDSLDGFVFPPFIPPSAARPVDPPAPPPRASVPPPPAEPQVTAPARPTMPWDVETPIVGGAADVAPLSAGADGTDEAEDEDLPWLERPAPRAAVDAPPAAPAQEPAAAQAADDFPDWMAWDDRDADEARSEAEGVAAVEGLDDFVPVDDLGSHFSPAPAVDWTEAEPVADAAAGIGAADAPVTEDPAGSSAWSLDAPEAAEPPLPFDGGTSSALAFDEPSAAGVAEPEPVAAQAPAAAVEPDPFTAASVSEAEQQAAPASAASPFADVAAQLEEIARTLRERPDELLGGSASDPLALLVAGYVMGYRARGGR
ncbi:MAG TPA: hypothetical protein VHG08_09915 [Longimicrobium sp.]|nr:hypothetical protein [Longimicrobium sp.]